MPMPEMIIQAAYHASALTLIAVGFVGGCSLLAIPAFFWEHRYSLWSAALIWVGVAFASAFAGSMGIIMLNATMS